jgi:Fe-S cluster biogenesis protein NfuA
VDENKIEADAEKVFRNDSQVGVGRLENLMRLRLGEVFVSHLGKCDGCQSSEPLCQERLRESVSNLIET